MQAIHDAEHDRGHHRECCVSKIPDIPGALAKNVIEPLSEAGVNIEYLYAYSETTETSAIVVLKVDDLRKASSRAGRVAPFRR